MASSPLNKKHAVVLLISLALILGLVGLMRYWHALPTTELKTALTADASAQPIIELEDGAPFGAGKVLIDNEEIEISRVNEDGIPINRGADVRKNPNTFKVLGRGLNGTTVSTHDAGTEVSVVGTLFFPEGNSTYTKEVDDLFYLILWITGIAFILTEAFFLFCVFSFWDKPGARAGYSHGNHTFELIATLSVVTILVLLALMQNDVWTDIKQEMPRPASSSTFTQSWNDMGPNGDGANRPPVEVQIVALRYKWFFRYPGRDGQFGTADDITTGTMTVPAERKILCTIRAMDVIHSFFMPNFRVKQDAVPGMAIPVWFEAQRPGDFQIMCAELCGPEHTTMGSFVKVLPQGEFYDWYMETSTDAILDNLGADPQDPDFDPEELDPSPRPDWYGSNAKYWWWWDSNPVKRGYAEDYGRGN